MISPATLHHLQEQTKQDSVLSQLSDLVLRGWPESRELVPSVLSPFWSYRDKLVVHDGVDFKGQQMMVPVSMQRETLHKLHASHQGSESCLRHAREFLYWQGMTAAIKEVHANCSTCASYNSAQHAKQPMLSHSIPVLSWQYVSQDLFTVSGHDYLITVDHYSDFFKVDQLINTTAAQVVDTTMRQFAQHGISQTVITDNGPQFVSAKYQQLAAAYDFVPKTSSPYYPRGNGKAESAVKIAKNFFKKAEDPWLVILDYRNTPTQGHRASPAQIFISHHTHGLLPASYMLLKPEVVRDVPAAIEARREKTKMYYDHHARLLPDLYKGVSACETQQTWSSMDSRAYQGPFGSPIIYSVNPWFHDSSQPATSALVYHY